MSGAARLASLAFASCLALLACVVDTAPDGARRTPEGDGPRVVFDVTKRPLPEIPQPNDIATFPDPTSRTGRRVNVSLVSPTRFESNARADFTTLEGWGTFAPITVAFERDPRTSELDAAIDLEDLHARTRGWDPADDPFYVIDLTTGVPVPLDVGKGNFPLAIAERGRYWPNDPRRDEDTILFETVEEGAGIAQSGYTPALDTDFDGVVDHPNVLRRANASGVATKIEDVIDWYERETDTLVLRPVVPLEEMHEYAVVLTDRLKSATGAPVRSPFENVHHAQQKAGAERVRSILSDSARKNYYGDVAGTGLDHVAFMWTFTTQPVFDDLRLLRDGLRGQGPFARLAREFDTRVTALPSVGLSLDPANEAPGAIDRDPRCAPVRSRPFIVRPEDVKETLHELLPRALGFRGEELRRLEESLDNVSHFVIGTFDSPYLLGDPKREDPNAHFTLNFKTGEGDVRRDTVQFWLAVPKATAKAKAPFPVTVWSHGSTLHADEILVRAGYFARQGVAMMGINSPGHGLSLDVGLKSLAASLLRPKCLSAWVTAITTGRDEDLNGDGTPDSGGHLWTAHVFHSRDNIRQSVLDAMQATRVLRSWDGALRATQDYDGDGAPNLAGDFDGDGVPDVGGPGATITTSGNSYGGVVAMVHGAVDHEIAAAAPISGGGGLMDVATRSSLVTDSVVEQALSPLVVAVPASAVPRLNGVAGTKCVGEERSVRFVVNDLTGSREIEIACLSPEELAEGWTILLSNLRNGERRCARSAEDGRFRVPIPANVGDRLDLQVYTARDAVASYGTCELVPGAPAGRRVRTFEQPAVTFGLVADGAADCATTIEDHGLEDQGCAQFRDRFFPVGSPLVAPQEGLGLRRQTPEVRRLFALSQVGLEPSDPVNFAPYYALRKTPGPDGAPRPPRPLLTFTTAGDPIVPSATGYAFARASGAIPFLPTGFAYTHPEWAAYATPRDLFTALGDETPNDALIEASVLEGVARLRRTRAGDACAPNYTPSEVCDAPPSARDCAEALVDADWLAEGKNLWDAPRLAVPLRLARDAGVTVRDVESLGQAWAPRLLSTPLAGDDRGYAGSVPLVGAVHAWTRPGGEHVFVNPNPCRAFDEVLYYDHVLIRFLATRGRELLFLQKPGSHHCAVREDCPFF